MGLARDPIVKYRFQIVYPQNLDNIGVRGNFGGAQECRAFGIKELRHAKLCNI